MEFNTVCLSEYLNELKVWNILLGYRGSVAHGMYIPNTDPDSVDDIDLMGIVIPPKDWYLGYSPVSSKLFPSNGTKEIMQGAWDIVLYEVRHMISLLAKGNPNVLSLLWLEPQQYIVRSALGQRLIESRNLFSGKHVFQSFAGYAHGQLHRMTHFKCEGYMGEKRKALIEKHGFDCKNGSHLIRLLRMCCEFLNDGQLLVDRSHIDAEELLEIKRGKWSLEKVKDEAARLFTAAGNAHDASTLPEKPDAQQVHELCMSMFD